MTPARASSPARAVATDGPLLLEQRQRPIFAGISALAGVLILVAAIMQTVGRHAKVQEPTVVLLNEVHRSGMDIASGIIEAFGSLAIAVTLVFLFDAARRRNPTAAPFPRIIALVGAGLTAIYSVGYWIEFTQKAHEFSQTSQQTYMDAHRILGAGIITVFELLGLVGALLVAMAIVLVSLNAMRVGLLTRFMGYVGMFAGALVLFQITPVPVVETYWFLALAVLFLGRWPSGQPVAWSSGQAVPWPSGQAVREQRIRAAEARGAGKAPRSGRAGRFARAAGIAQASTPEPPAPEASAKNGASAAKRKRKRRR